MPKKSFTVEMKPSQLTKRMSEHVTNPSEGTKWRVLAKRYILGKEVIFYTNGMRKVEGQVLQEQEAYNSELLRFAHASLLINAPVGDKNACYVDATKDPVEIWLYGMQATIFIKKTKYLVQTQQLDPKFLLEEPIQKTVEKRNGRNVRLFGR